VALKASNRTHGPIPSPGRVKVSDTWYKTDREPAPEPHPALLPSLARVYRQKGERLEQALKNPAITAAAVEALGTLIDAIVVRPGEKRGEVSLELRGDLAAFLWLDEGRGPSTDAARRRATAAGAARGGGAGADAGESMGSLVAGTGFEPGTFRL
jgi:site-specific DNA recombinase